ncbi:MAG: four helix bundle protein [Draconibacterium sp.]|nr:four helix bundle protein [Draconibacterium sp.]
MKEKEIFVENLKKRTKKFGVDVILFCDSLKVCKASAVVTYQLVKSATSTGANYRAACRGRSDNEFFSKICIVVEECDESVFWLEIIEETALSNNITELKRLLIEGNEILKILSKSKDTTYKNLNSKKKY